MFVFLLRTSLLNCRPVINWCVEINAPRAVDFNAPRCVEINRAAVMNQKNISKNRPKIRPKIGSKKYPRGRARSACSLGAPPKAALFASNFWSDFLSIFLMIFVSIFGAFLVGPKAFLREGPGGRQPPPRKYYYCPTGVYFASHRSQGPKRNTNTQFLGTKI